METHPRHVTFESSIPGAIYHVMSRGNRQGASLLDDVDRQDFLKTLAETCVKADFQIHACCLMRNRFLTRASVEGEGGLPEWGQQPVKEVGGR